MPSLTLSLFEAAHDAEAAQYRILAGLADAQSAFTDCRVAPYLDDLVSVHAALRSLVSGAEAIEHAGTAIGVDWTAGRLIREGTPAPLAVELARWALPYIESVMSEGQTLYQFAAEHAALEAVGVVPAYRDEGFLLVRDGLTVQALRYRVSPLAGPDGRYRALRTVSLDLDLNPFAPAGSWKQVLAQAAPDLASPAAFQLQADVDLPVQETLIPIAKRKLLGMVQSWGEA